MVRTCHLDSFGVAVLLEGIVSPGDEAGEEAPGLHDDSTQDNLAGGVRQHRITLDNNDIHVKWKKISPEMFHTFPMLSY